MATHYHARDRTVLKNSRDGLQKENLRTKETVSVSKKEKDLLLNAAGERTVLSGGNAGSVSGISHRKPSIRLDEADGKPSENVENVPLGAVPQETVVVEPTTQCYKDTTFKGDEHSFGAFQEDSRPTNLSFSAEKHDLFRNDYASRSLKQRSEGVVRRKNQATDSLPDKDGINGETGGSADRYWQESVSAGDACEEVARKKPRHQKTQDLFSSLYPEEDGYHSGIDRYHKEIRQIESEDITSDLQEHTIRQDAFRDESMDVRVFNMDDNPAFTDDAKYDLLGEDEVIEAFDGAAEEAAQLKWDDEDAEERSDHSQSADAGEGTDRYEVAYETDTGNHYQPIDGEGERYFQPVKSEDSKALPRPESAAYSSRRSRRKNQYYGESYSQYQSRNHNKRQSRHQIQNQSQYQNLHQNQSQFQHQSLHQTQYQSRHQSQNHGKTDSSDQARGKPHSHFGKLSFADEGEARSKRDKGRSASKLYAAGKSIKAISNTLSIDNDDDSNADDVSEEIIAGGISATRAVSMRSEQMIHNRFTTRGAREKLHFGRTPNPPRNRSRQSVKQWQKEFQKKRYQRRYHQAQRTGGLFGSGVAKSNGGKAAKQSAKGAAKEAIRLIVGGKKSVAVVIVLLILVLVMVMSTFSGCVATMGGMASILSTTYPGTDEDIQGVDAAYTDLENKLDKQVNEMETTHPDYDEYRYQVDEITHNPFQLASILAAKYGNYTLDDVKDELPIILNLQYTLNVTEEVEIRTRTVTDPETGEETEEEYDYYILNIELTNHGLDYVAEEYLTDEQKSLYEAYVATHGNRDDLFDMDAITASPGGGAAGGIAYEIPPEALSDARFRNMINEAEKYLGYPYVWGGSNPSTSFDCSGFVAWVINNCGNGWSIGRPTAEGIRRMCMPVQKEDAKPGDLIFFQGTYDTPGASHIGIYVGNGMMIHCGKPIQYTNINTSYWRQHFYMFGRLS